MKLYLLSQTVNNDYDTYDSVIVCAESEDKARLIRPDMTKWDQVSPYYYGSWVKTSDEVNVKYLGEADSTISQGVVLASYNAG